MARILVVDDKKAHRRWIADVLRLEGYEVDVAESGPQTLDMLGQQWFDLVTLDQQMPGMSGLECYANIQALKPLMRVMFITVFGDDPAFSGVRSQGWPILVKPLTSDQIVTAVRRLLGEP